MGRYADAYTRSLVDREAFWLDAAKAIEWNEAPSRAVDDSDTPFYHWFPDGTLNTCHNALDRHVAAGHGQRIALIYDSAMTGRRERHTYEELRDEVARFAGVLRESDVHQGDRVLIYMPMVPQAVVAMLACARIGAVHSVVFGGFAPSELAARIEDAEPVVIVAASCGLEPNRIIQYKPIIDQALAMTRHQPRRVIVLQREEVRAAMTERDLDWHEAMSAASPADCVPVRATDPLYVLYTSGTTGRPKGVVRDNGGHAVALSWAMPNVYDVGPGEVMWAASDVGWQVGHTCVVYGPLLVGATTVLYEGKPVGTPDAGAFWRVIAEHDVKVLVTAPTAMRAIRQVDSDAVELRRYDLARLQYLFLAGERLDPHTYKWASDTLGVPVLDHWWQTETGWPACANLRGLEPMPIKAGSPTVPVPGFDIQILAEDGQPVPRGQEGAFCIKLPLPPGTLTTLWNDDDRYRDSYLDAYPGYYHTGDSGYLDGDGYVYVMGRVDDVINVAGHRLSTGVMEAVLSAHPAVAECAVIGVTDPLKGQVPCGLAVLKAGVTVDEAEFRNQLIAMIREEIGPVAAFRDVVVVDRLPKTRSGKILRQSMRAIAEGRDEPVPATIEDPASLESLRPLLQREATQ
jgi:propionyl-CoA synthetase